MPDDQHTFLSGSVEETHALGRVLGALALPGDVVLLSGPLGAGKTALTQGIGRGLGIALTVNSPTFTLLKEYEGRLPLYHFDLYRLDDPAEVYDLGFEDYFAGAGISVIEWAERGLIEGEPSPWGTDWLEIQIESRGETERAFHAQARGERGRARLRALIAAASAEPRSAAPVEGR